MASEMENTIRELESLACSCDAMIGQVCEAHKVTWQLRQLINKELEKNTNATH